MGRSVEVHEIGMLEARARGQSDHRADNTQVQTGPRSRSANQRMQRGNLHEHRAIAMIRNYA